MSDGVANEISEIAASVFDVSPDVVRETADLERLESWDSLHQLNLMLALEESFGIELSPDDLGELRHLVTIEALVRRHRPGA